MSQNATHFLYNESLPKVDISVCRLPLATLRLCQKQTQKEAENQKGKDKHLCLESQGEGYVAFRISAVRMFNDCFLLSQRDLSFPAAQDEWLPWMVYTTEVSGAGLGSTRYPWL